MSYKRYMYVSFLVLIVPGSMWLLTRVRNSEALRCMAVMCAYLTLVHHPHGDDYPLGSILVMCIANVIKKYLSIVNTMVKEAGHEIMKKTLEVSRLSWAAKVAFTSA